MDDKDGVPVEDNDADNEVDREFVVVVVLLKESLGDNDALALRLVERLKVIDFESLPVHEDEADSVKLRD